MGHELPIPAEANAMEKNGGGSQPRLDEIATEWAIIHDPAQFVRRYAPAIQSYLNALIKNQHDAEDVAQDFFVRVAKNGFVRARQDRGRFRDYLKTAVRNAALSFLKRQHGSKHAQLHEEQQPVTGRHQRAAEQAWDAQWRHCLLDRACKALEKHQQRSPGNLFHTVMALLLEHPNEDATALATRTSELIGRTVRPDAFRKQVSRARRALAKYLVKEVATTLDRPTAEQVKEELIELSLWEYVRDFVPRDLAT
jgi:RNA polymerase sigma-70 factor (ECF subfamily)